MKIRDLDGLLVSDLRITFDEDPHDGVIDIIVPVTTERFSDILGEGVLGLDIYLMKATDDALVVSTSTRGC